MKNTHVCMLVSAMGVVGFLFSSSAQTPRPVPTPTRWQYATISMAMGDSGPVGWIINLPGDKTVDGKDAAELAKQLNVPAAGGGLLGVYQVMGEAGWEIVSETRNPANANANEATFKRPM